MNIEVESFYQWLSNVDKLDTNNIFDIFNQEEKRNSLYKFFNQEKKMQELCEELYLKQENDDKYSKFIENIILMYPLTKKLILKLNEEGIKEDGKSLPALLRSDKYVGGFYTGLLKDFNSLLEKTKNNSAIQKLKQKIEIAEIEIEKYRDEVNEIKKLQNQETLSKVAERDRLKTEVKKLKEDTDIEKLEDEIENLEQEINRLKEKKRKKQNRKKELVIELDKLKLNELEEKEVKAIETLMSIWQDDESNK